MRSLNGSPLRLDPLVLRRPLRLREGTRRELRVHRTSRREAGGAREPGARHAGGQNAGVDVVEGVEGSGEGGDHRAFEAFEVLEHDVEFFPGLVVPGAEGVAGVDDAVAHLL